MTPAHEEVCNVFFYQLSCPLFISACVKPLFHLVQAIALGLLGGPPMRGGRGRGLHFPTGIRGRGVGRGRYNSVLTVDRRPKQVLVKGYSVDDRDDVVAHFSVSCTFIWFPQRCDCP